MRRITLGMGILLAVSAIFSACAFFDDDGPVEGTISVSESLIFGSEIDSGMLVEFVEVTNDSRCAAGVQCVWAGEASVTLKTTGLNSLGKITTYKMAPGELVTIYEGAITITLLELRPDPPPAGGVEQSEYELRLRIEKA